MFNKISKLLLLSFIATLAACSSGDQVKRESNNLTALDSGMYLSEPDENGIRELIIPEVSEYVEVKDKAEEKENMEALDYGVEEVAVEDKEEISRSIASIGADEPVEEVDDSVAMATGDDEDTDQSVMIEDKDSFEMYEVQKRDSLMLISFKLYQRFDKWKDIAQWNGLENNRSFKVKAGTKIKVKISDGGQQAWQPNGLAYLIKRGDYLGKISRERYEGSSRFWYYIWKNNDVLIKNPNKVFAGFTIYTETLDEVLAHERERLGSNPPKRELANKVVEVPEPAIEAPSKDDSVVEEEVEMDSDIDLDDEGLEIENI